MRDGDTRLMDQADRLEDLARRQYDRRINGTKLNAQEIFRRSDKPDDPPAETTGRRGVPRGPRTIR